MKITRFAIVALAAVTLLACNKKDERKSYTFVQYNVGVFEKFEGSGVDAVKNAVKELGADAVTLNELDSCTTRTGQVDQLAVFAEAMGGWNHHYASAMPYRGGAYGVGVASSPALKVLRTDKVALPKLDGREPRAVSVMEFEDFVLASTHLDLTLESQLAQVAVINHYVDSLYSGEGKPVFIGGDFNCEPGSEPIVLMEQTWELLSPVTYSYPSYKPIKCIDFIFVRPRGHKVTVGAAGIPATLETSDPATASDHLPVFVKVTIE